MGPLPSPPGHPELNSQPCQRSVGCERAERHCLVRKGGARFGSGPPPSPRSSVRGGQCLRFSGASSPICFGTRRVLCPVTHGSRSPFLLQLCTPLPVVTTPNPCLLPVPVSVSLHLVALLTFLAPLTWEQLGASIWGDGGPFSTTPGGPSRRLRTHRFQTTNSFVSTNGSHVPF